MVWKKNFAHQEQDYEVSIHFILHILNTYVKCETEEKA